MRGHAVLTLVVFVIPSAGLAMGITLCLLLVSLLSPTACGLEGARCTRTRPTLLQSLRGGSPSLRTIRLEGAKRVLAGMHYRALSPV